MARKINVSASCFLPAALFSLRWTARLAERAGFAAVEGLPFWGTVLGGVPNSTAVPIETAHCHFNPTWKKRFAAIVVDTILFPPHSWCESFLTELAARGVPVNTYFIEDLEKWDIYTSYQAAPCFGILLEDVVSRLEEAGVNVTFDLSHMRDGEPFPNWRTCWEVLKNRVGNVHVQALNPAEPNSPELEAMWKGNQDIEIAEMLRTIVKSGYEGPFTLEVDACHMVKILGWKALLPQTQVWYLSKLREFVEQQLE